MQQNKEKGKAGEELAIAFLQKNNYQILFVNWRTAHLELDIIAKQNNTTVFVEVKSRVGDEAGYPEKGVTKAKIKNIKVAALAYMQSNETDKIRFDIIAITFLPQQKPAIYHIEDAFF